MNNKLIVFIVAIIFIVSFLVGHWLSESDQKIQQFDKISMQYPACNPVLNECQALLDNTQVSTLFLQKPTALKPFEIEVRVDKPDIQEVRMDFRMPAMNMGVNFYRLNKVNNSLWKGQVILPVCTSRRSDWIAELQVEYQGKLWVAEYGFSQSIEN